MATPSEKLADSLEQLHALQSKTRMKAIPGAKLSRVHRQRLVKNGFLEEVLRGWYIPTRPSDAKGDSAPWYASMPDFVAGYADERFGSNWHISPEQSLLLRTGDRTLPKQIQVWAPEGHNQTAQLPHGCSLLVYRAPRLYAASALADVGNLRLVEIPGALVAVSPNFYTRNPLAAQIALRSLPDASDLTRILLAGSHSIVAGRLVGALRAVGRGALADDVLGAMKAASYVVTEADPFEAPVHQLPGGRAESPYCQRLRLMWADMRGCAVAAFPKPAAPPSDVTELLKDIEARYVTDAYHSLSIEGYRVTPELIEQVRRGSWNPDGADRETRDAMAAKGYAETFKLVEQDVETAARGTNPGSVFRSRLGNWYRALFSPSVQAGIVKATDLAGYRNDQVFIKGALHVPISKEAVRECMPVLFELLEQEQNAAVRAVLGHFVFVYIHPYMDGNGRLARFLMNLMLASCGYPWTVVPVERRNEYMAALEQASSFNNIEPFVRFIGGLVAEQARQPLPRPR